MMEPRITYEYSEKTSQLIERLFSGVKSEDVAQLQKAVDTAAYWHKGQIREGGEEYVNHVIRVALRVAERVGWEEPERATRVRQAALLHDVLEDTDIPDDEIRDDFGENVLGLVRAVSHITEEEPDKVYFARIAAGGPDAVLIKRCDRLENIDDLRHAQPEFRAEKIAATREALPLWETIDPEGTPEIASALDTIAAFSPDG